MSIVFIGGSRHISRLPAEIKARLDKIIVSAHDVVVGDANGADKAIQKYLHESAYENVTVFSAGEPRNNLGLWPTRKISPPRNVKGFEFFATKDREMAREAEFGLMIWDGKSPGTILNILRLVNAGKIAVLFSSTDNRAINFKGPADWTAFVSHTSNQLIEELRKRATPDEWQQGHEQRGLDLPSIASPASRVPARASLAAHAAALNTALAAADPPAVLQALGTIARTYGMTQIAKETGLARESLYRALDADGNPEFATVMKVMSYLGFNLTADASQPVEKPASRF